ncbi:hypothetical protein [Rhizobium favelukesii]|uniref:Uncharacterized protein n=1 Tax=Rhizobium favelukesii TaxID=348824 RepID=W6RES8_9HYPH|nr:hypothetical protein [Rhizobium favelukesii]MCS0460836.1 hypothetical protein [Rhizobium favelukesii]CDM57178.1 hypothetical protein LPU83_1506 [Rhizobium favelukesii]
MHAEIKGPSLADVLAFTMIEKAADVARVERAVAHRMSVVRGWVGWRVIATEMDEDEDDLWRVKVFCDPIGGGHRELAVFQFLVSHGTKRRSHRFESFVAACGLKAISDTDDLNSRYFATKDGGRTAADFGSLTNAIVA